MDYALIGYNFMKSAAAAPAGAPAGGAQQGAMPQAGPFPAGPQSLQGAMPPPDPGMQTEQLAAEAEAQKAQEEQAAQLQELQSKVQELALENTHLKNKHEIISEREKVRAEIAKEREQLAKDKKEAVPTPEAPKAQKLDPHTFIGMHLKHVNSRIKSLTGHSKAAFIAKMATVGPAPTPAFKPATGFLGGVERYINSSPDHFKNHSIPGIGHIPGVNAAADFLNNVVMKPIAYHAYKTGDSFGQGHYGDSAKHLGAYALNTASLAGGGAGVAGKGLSWAGRAARFIPGMAMGAGAQAMNPDPYSSEMKVGNKAIGAQDELNQFAKSRIPKAGPTPTFRSPTGGPNRNAVDQLQQSGYWHPEVFGTWPGAENGHFNNPLAEFGAQMASPFILPQVDDKRNQSAPISGFSRSPMEQFFHAGQIMDPDIFRTRLMGQQMGM